MSCKLIQDIHDKMNMSNFHCNKNVYPKTKTHRTKMMFKKAKTASVSISIRQNYMLLKRKPYVFPHLGKIISFEVAKILRP